MTTEILLWKILCVYRINSLIKNQLNSSVIKKGNRFKITQVIGKAVNQTCEETTGDSDLVVSICFLMTRLDSTFINSQQSGIISSKWFHSSIESQPLTLRKTSFWFKLIKIGRRIYSSSPLLSWSMVPSYSKMGYSHLNPPIVCKVCSGTLEQLFFGSDGHSSRQWIRWYTVMWWFMI